MSEHDDYEPHHASSPTDHVLSELQLYGYRPFTDEPDPRPLPEGDHVAGAIADIFDALIVTFEDTRLEPDLDDLLWSTVNVFHRATDRIERELDDNEQAQRRGQREQDGSEVKAVELERLTAEGQTMIERRNAFELSGVDLANVNFRYAIEGDRAPWRPLRAFDDGRQVFIEFPRGIGQGEMPPLFVVGPEGNTSELVNYRVRGHHMIVDRLFAAAELRFGSGREQKRVRIVRTDGRPTS